ncbi:MAG: thiamine ABC transporter substrate-binding protein [Candidatus Hodarchaeales archaeon]
MITRSFSSNNISRIFSKKTQLLFTGLVILMITSSTTTPDTLFSISQTPRLTIYAYESLLNYGLNATATNQQIFDTFETDFDCIIDLEYFSDAGAALAKVIAERDSPQADIIIGIDNTMIFEAKKQNILVAYEPSTSENITSSAIHGLDPDFYVTPYDYGFISLIYDKDRVNTSLLPEPDLFTLEDLKNPELAKLLVTEDPTLSSTGLGFLMWTIGVYDKVLGLDWKTWWNEVSSYIQVEKSWGDAFDVFYQEAAKRPIMVSYATDPAYNYLWFDQDTSVDVLLSHENDDNYAWLQIEGLGIIEGTENLELAQNFIEWFTQPIVQELIPENNWMYPSNIYAPLPASFDYATDPSTVTPLNDLFTATELVESLEEWRSDWEEIMILGRQTTLPAWVFFLIPLLFLLFIRKKVYS